MSKITKVPATTTDQEILPSSGFSRRVIIYNTSPGIMYVALGTAASRDLFTTRLLPNFAWETPAVSDSIHAVWLSDDGSAMITEIS